MGQTPFELTGGAVCLDFANTVDNRPDPARRRDLVADYGALVAWARQAGVLSAAEAARLRAAARLHASSAAAALGRAVALREAIYRIFSARAAGRPAPAADLAALNRWVAAAGAHRRVVQLRKGFVWEWVAARDDFDRVLWPVARSAADLLTAGRAAPVRECAAGTCGWLFLDTSRNRSRRWCDMKVCGNRAKARRFYRRVRAGRP